MALADDIDSWREIKEKLRKRTEKWKEDLNGVPNDTDWGQEAAKELSRKYDEEMKQLEREKKGIARELQDSIKNEPGNAEITDAKNRLSDAETTRDTAATEAFERAQRAAENHDDDAVDEAMKEWRNVWRDFWKTKYKILDDLADAL